MRYLRYIVFVFVFVCIDVSSFAGDNNPGIWVGAGVEKELSKQWSIGVDAEYRGMQGFGKTDRMSIGISGEYKPWKFLKVGAGYEYLHSHEAGDYTSTGKYYKSSYWYPRHRFNISVTGQIKLCKRLRLSLRERWMYTNRPEFERNRLCVNTMSDEFNQVESKTVESKNKHVLRSRLMLDYNIKKFPVIPFMSFEVFNGWNVEKLRYQVGADWEITKRHSMKVYYLYQDNKDDADAGVDDDFDGYSHVIGVSYKFKF